VVVANGGGKAPGAFIFKNTGLTCGDVSVKSLYPGTTVTIDGTNCPLS
jgi:hypothetical protein